MDRKTVTLGTFPPDERTGLDDVVRVEMQIRPTDKGPELTISGQTRYSAGQILDDVRRLLGEDDSRLKFPREKVAKLLNVWERWHLNALRSGCEHQRASWDPLAKVELVTYKQTGKVLTKAHATERAAVEQLRQGRTVTYTAEENRLANLPYEIVQDATLPAPGPEFEVSKRETKTAGWVKPDESPAGLLCKPCEVCGFRYGSAWLYEPLPADVVAFVEDF